MRNKSMFVGKSNPLECDRKARKQTSLKADVFHSNVEFQCGVFTLIGGKVVEVCQLGEESEYRGNEHWKGFKW